VRGHLVVVGDALLDVDLDGTATRLTPDAPVPVVDGLVETARPGGAGLAAAMAAADGAEVVLVTSLGDDEAGARVESLLGSVEVRRLRYDGPTPVKQRVRAGGQPLLRLDHGDALGRLGDDAAGLEEALDGAAAVLVADYGRGVTTVPAVRELLAGLPSRVPLVWDPHPRGPHPVPGARLVTPNEVEAATFAHRVGAALPVGTRGLAAVGRHAEALVAGWDAQAVAVTLGERGALLSYGHGAPVVAPAPAVRCTDPCGAGDRFASAVALRLGAGRVLTEALQDAVEIAARYVAAGGPSSLGVTPVTPPEPATAEELAASVAARGGTVVATGGCFDLLHAGHVATLRAARRLGDCLVVCLNSDASVRRLKGPARPLVPAADRARVLEALECVDAVVVFDEDTPVEAIRRLRPQVWAKGGDYAGAEIPETPVLAEWGGQVVALPYLEGRSTTALVGAAASRAEAHDDHRHDGDVRDDVHDTKGAAR
jgi:rfaE bifunctional protein nucleotidyltransferase chain/domain/rfaE bifunctional protein kinase chain/domain